MVAVTHHGKNILHTGALGCSQTLLAQLFLSLFGELTGGAFVVHFHHLVTHVGGLQESGYLCGHARGYFLDGFALVVEKGLNLTCIRAADEGHTYLEGATLYNNGSGAAFTLFDTSLNNGSAAVATGVSLELHHLCLQAE